MGEMWKWLGSSIGSFMFLYAMFQRYFPQNLQVLVEKYVDRLVDLFNPYIRISIHEFIGERLKRSEVYTAVKAYLSTPNSTKRAKRLRADNGKDSKNLLLSMDDYQEVTDEYRGVKLWWSSQKIMSNSQTISYFAAPEKHYYTLSFHKRHHELIVGSYLNHVLEEGKAIGVQNRQRRLYTNNPSDNSHGYKATKWSHVEFNHPAKFQTLAMDPKKKKELMDDLVTFSKAKDYYAKIGKAWKRGYLFHGPPGTGKSTMIAAMANLLDYDIYDLELTTVKDNSELRKLLIETPSKSIIMIEDIDCSLDLTGERKKKKKKKEQDRNDEIQDPVLKKANEESDSKESKVTLSGLLNFIDGLWSACSGERLIVVTTNFVEKLDPALVRRGRMDMHIEMSYCTFEGFKVLAKNYLDLDSHHLFQTIRQFLEKTQMTPADVAENLMLKTTNVEGTKACLENLIQALETKLRDDEKAKECEPMGKDGGNELSTTKDEAKENVQKAKEESDDNKESKVTLSGLLNFMDGLWSGCSGERLIVVTTNYVEKLDPALIRRGRMDKHIELSYCTFEAFKVLAKNYLDLNSHHLFETIQQLLEKAQMTPADVAENLMLKTVTEDTKACLESLIQALETKLKDDEKKAAMERKSSSMDEAKEGDSSTKDETKEPTKDEVKENGHID